jgi:hypothetical protein
LGGFVVQKVFSVLVVGLIAALALPAAGSSHPIAPRRGPLHLVGASGGNFQSTNWSGYAAHGVAGAFTSVAASWVEPTGKCTSATTYSSFWVGLDGYHSNSVEQTGTSVDCSGGAPVYYAWYEMFPKFPKMLRLTITPGDHITASVTTDSHGSFTMKLTDTTTGKSQTTVKTLASAKLKSAEVIAEAPSSSTGVLPLTNFGKVSFSAATMNGGALSSANPDEITMVQGNGNPKATPSAISGGNAFSVTWNHK